MDLIIVVLQVALLVGLCVATVQTRREVRAVLDAVRTPAPGTALHDAAVRQAVRTQGRALLRQRLETRVAEQLAKIADTR